MSVARASSRSLRPAAILTIAVALGLVSQTASSADDKLKNFPLLYDANDRLVGPVFGNSTAIQLNGQVVQIRLRRNGFEDGGPAFFFEQPDCVGPRLMRHFLVPTIRSEGDSIFFPNNDYRPTAIRSAAYSSGAGSACSNFAGEPWIANVAQAVQAEKSALGITFPVRVGSPISPSVKQ